jgi:isopentenyl-diphosphate Delta-isomerase
LAEYLEIFDESNQSLGRTKLRRLVHQDGDWHRTTQIYVVNRQLEVLCNLRSQQKEVFPGLWDLSIGGHLDPGETYGQAAVRELAEELGITVHPEELQPVGYQKIDGMDAVNKLMDREHAALFLYRTDMPLGHFAYPADEITKLGFFSLDYLQSHLRKP